MLAKTPIEQRFINWVAEQPPERRYQWHNHSKCACGLFLREEMGLTVNEVTRGYVAVVAGTSYDPDVFTVWETFNSLAQCDSKDSTFGSLRKRLEAQ